MPIARNGHDRIRIVPETVVPEAGGGAGIPLRSRSRGRPARHVSRALPGRVPESLTRSRSHAHDRHSRPDRRDARRPARRLPAVGTSAALSSGAAPLAAGGTTSFWRGPGQARARLAGARRRRARVPRLGHRRQHRDQHGRPAGSPPGSASSTSRRASASSRRRSCPYSESSSYLTRLSRRRGWSTRSSSPFSAVSSPSRSASSSASRDSPATGLVQKIATFYIELFRNIPLLLQILFWYRRGAEAAARTARAARGGRQRLVLAEQPRHHLRRADRSARFPVRLVGLLRRHRADVPGARLGPCPADAHRSAVPGRLDLARADRRPAADRVPRHRSPRSGSSRPRCRVSPCVAASRSFPEFIALLLALVIYNRRVHRRDRPCRHPVGQRRADRGGLGARHQAQSPHAPGGRAAGDARHRAAADEPVPEPDQELEPRHRDRLPGPVRRVRRHDAEPDRAGGSRSWP